MLTGGSKRRGRSRGGIREINVTPLVDVMLVLLVVFMVTAPMLSAGLHIALPKVHAADPSTTTDHDEISITRAGAVFLGDRDISAHLTDALTTLGERSTTHLLYVRADADARYASVARAISAAKVAGLTSISLMVDTTTSASGEPSSVASPASKAPRK